MSSQCFTIPNALGKPMLLHNPKCIGETNVAPQSTIKTVGEMGGWYSATSNNVTL